MARYRNKSREWNPLSDEFGVTVLQAGRILTYPIALVSPRWDEIVEISSLPKEFRRLDDNLKKLREMHRKQ